MMTKFEKLLAIAEDKEDERISDKVHALTLKRLDDGDLSKFGTDLVNGMCVTNNDCDDNGKFTEKAENYFSHGKGLRAITMIDLLLKLGNHTTEVEIVSDEVEADFVTAVTTLGKPKTLILYSRRIPRKSSKEMAVGKFFYNVALGKLKITPFARRADYYCRRYNSRGNESISVFGIQVDKNSELD